MPKKVLFIAMHRINRSPGQRFRFEQYIQYLSENGYECELSYLLNEREDKIFYTPSHLFEKVAIVIKSSFQRSKDVLRANQYDLIFIFREAFFTGPILFERLLKKTGTPLIFDFDDAIWLPNVSDANKKWSWLKNVGKTGKIIELCDHIVAGNEYLANYSKQFNKNITIIPTTIDIQEYFPLAQIEKKSPICIGWSGSITTIKHFEYAINFLKKLKAKYKNDISIKVIGDKNYINNELEIRGVPWKKETEIYDLSSIDIGIMPLPNDNWSNGKCGLKGLQYMALAIPTIMSPVGVNTEIIQDGHNGFLADSDAQWIDKISNLIDSKELRTRIGKEGRKTVIEKYSVTAHKEKYLNLFNDLIYQVTTNRVESKQSLPLARKAINTNEESLYQKIVKPTLAYSLIETNKIGFNEKTLFRFNLNSTNIHTATVKSFGEEWLKFSAFTTKETEIAFNQYFDIVTDDILNKNSVVLDLGCGNGRWSKCLASKVKFIEAIDPSDSVYSAIKLTSDINNIRITQASVDHIPFENDSFDFVMSLGVLHHIPDTAEAMKKCTLKLKKGGWFLVYLYYNLEGRSLFLRLPFLLSNFLRKIISRLPTVLKHMICDLIACFIYLPFVGLSMLIKALFRNKNWYKSIPLSYYIDKSFIIIRNDALDRFGTPLENRFSQSEIHKMMTDAGLTNIKFSTNEPYWHAIGQKVNIQ